jgi:hypothetical protein
MPETGSRTPPPDEPEAGPAPEEDALPAPGSAPAEEEPIGADYLDPKPMDPTGR